MAGPYVGVIDVRTKSPTLAAGEGFIRTLMLSDWTPKDYMAVAAIVLSIASLLCSMWTFRFNRHAKSIELRSQLLMKIADAKNNAVNAVDDFQTLVRDAATTEPTIVGEFEAFTIRAKKLRDQLEVMYETVDGRNSTDVLVLYKKFFHGVHDIQTQIADLRHYCNSRFGSRQSGLARAQADTPTAPLTFNIRSQ